MSGEGCYAHFFKMNYILSSFRVFPVTINSTTIFNMGPVVGPMLSLLQQETLPDDGVAECQKVISDNERDRFHVHQCQAQKTLEI